MLYFKSFVGILLFCFFIGCNFQNQDIVNENINQQPEWYTKDVKKFIADELHEMDSTIMQEMKLCFSLADITGDGTPELFLGQQSGLKTCLVDYQVYSLTDQRWLVPNIITSGGSDDKGTSIYLIQDDYRFDLFRNYYCLDKNSNKYYLGGSYSYYPNSRHQSGWEHSPFTSKLQFLNNEWSTTYISDIICEINSIEEYVFFPTSTIVVNKTDIEQSVDLCVARYQEKLSYA